MKKPIIILPSNIPLSRRENRLKEIATLPVRLEDEIGCDMLIKTMINLSGGLDSTYCLWKWLKENKKETILIHHINLKSREAKIRSDKEALATKEILTYFKQNNMGNFEYIESSFDYSNFGYTVRDSDIIFFIVGILFRNQKYRKIENIIMPYSKEDFQDNNYRNLELRRYQLMDLISDRKKINFIFPIENMTRSDILNNMPGELITMCWYCRTPLSNGEPCGKCRTCRQTNVQGGI